MMSEDTAPVNIWLQWYEYDDSEWAERTWCQDKQNDSDVEYIRADVEYIRADVAQAQLDAANKRIAELVAAQLKAHQLKYYIGNPSAWQNYDESVSEAIREAVNITGKAQ